MFITYNGPLLPRLRSERAKGKTAQKKQAAQEEQEEQEARPFFVLQDTRRDSAGRQTGKDQFAAEAGKPCNPLKKKQLQEQRTVYNCSSTKGTSAATIRATGEQEQRGRGQQILKGPRRDETTSPQ